MLVYFRGWCQCILVCLLTCPLKRAHQYICHHWITLQIKKIINKSKWIFWITRELFPIILVQDPQSDPLWKKHCMTNKKIFNCFQYPVKQQYLQYPGNPSTQGVVMWHPCFHMCLYFNKWRIYLQFKPRQIW